jgi:hypothetical protein
MPADAPYDVYLIDPGTHGSQVITLVQEITRLSTPECAEMVHDTPARIASFTERRAAEDLAARFREFDALAIVRRPGEKTPGSPVPPSVVPQPRLPVAIGLIVLGIVQTVVAIGWLLPGSEGGARHVLLGMGGLLLGFLATFAGIWKLRRDDLD